MECRRYGSDPLSSAGSRQEDRNGNVPSDGISAIRVKDKGVPLGPGMAVTVEGEELLTLRCSPLLGNQRIPVPMGLGKCFKVYHLTFQYLIRLTEKMLQLLTVFLQYVDES
jgi:hypothetical protein